MANKKREKPKHLGRGLASLFDPITSGGAEAVLKSGLGMPSAKTVPEMPKTRSGLGMLSAKTVLQMLKTKSGLGMLRTKTALGIDISNTRINLALLKKGKNGVELLNAASGPVPDGAIENGNVENATALAEAIKKLKAKNGIRCHQATLSLVAEPVLMQILDIPENFSDNVRQFMQNEVKNYAVLPRQSVAIDFCGIKPSGRPKHRRAVVVAVDGQKLTRAARVFNREGLSIDALEPAWVAYIRACYAKKIAKRFDRNILLAVVRDGTLALCLFRNETLEFLRTKRLEADECESETYCEYLAEEINAVIQFCEFEMPGKCKKWQVSLVAGVSEASIKEKMLSLVGRLNAVDLEVRTLEDAYLDTPVADPDPGNTPSAIAVGLAMKLLDIPGCSLNINLLPPEVAEARSAEKQVLLGANVGALILFLMILSVGFFNVKVNKLNNDIKQKTQMNVRENTPVLLNQQAALERQIADISQGLSAMNQALGTGRFLKWGISLMVSGLQHLRQCE